MWEYRVRVSAIEERCRRHALWCGFLQEIIKPTPGGPYPPVPGTADQQWCDHVESPIETSCELRRVDLRELR